MKPLLFTAIVLFIGLAGRGQVIAEHYTTTLEYRFQTYSSKNTILSPEFVVSVLSGDTLTISDTSIHFIKIGSYTFTIYKNMDGDTTLERAYKPGELMEMWRRKDSIIHAQTGLLPK